MEEIAEQAPTSLQETDTQKKRRGRRRRGRGDDEEVAELRPSLEEVEEIIGYTFNDKRLLEQAFTAPSDPQTMKKGLPSYQRLEFLGDSVLNFVIAAELYNLYPDFQQGTLTDLRSANVDNLKLARVAVDLNLYKFLRHGIPLFDDQVQDFKDEISKYPPDSKGLIDERKVLADIVESTIGAVFIDSNSSIETVSKVIKSLVQPMITPETLQTNPVTKLNEICQKYGLEKRVEDLWKETREIQIYVRDELVGTGKNSPNKEIAVNRAAEDAYNEIVRRLGADVAKLEC